MADWDRNKAVGFVGVGVMGGGMASNVIARGFPVIVYDLDPERVAALTAQGARQATSAAEVAQLARIQVCVVETTDQAEAVIVGENGLIDGALDGDCVLCCSTITPQVVEHMYQQLGSNGVALLDAPISGGSTRAKDGELTAIVGGDTEAVERVRPVLDAFANRVFHVGPIGKGLAMKLVNNMVLQISTVALAEAFVLGAKAGLDAQTMYDVMRVSTAASFSLEMRAPRFMSGDFSPGGTIDINYKDQELETAFAKSLGVPLFMANVSQQVFQMGKANDMGKLDSAALIELYEDMAGVQVGTREKPSN